MRTLIINGSPRVNGDTAFLLSELKSHLNNEVIEINAYNSNIKPCIDCRACKKQKGCVIKDDDMQTIYSDNFDSVVIASPIYMSNLTAPIIGLASRFQAYYCAKRFLNDAFIIKEKKAALMLVGGGDGSPEAAIKLSEWMFKKMNAQGFKEHLVLSLRTDDISANQDAEAIRKVQEIAQHLNCR
jgi:multimeric flavodoxin WrbA